MSLTSVETKTEFLYELDKLSTGAVPDMPDEKVELAINRTVEKFIKNRYRPVKGLIDRDKGFEEIQKRIDDLSLLVNTVEVTSVAVAVETNVQEIDLSDLGTGVPLYMFFLRGRVQVDGVYRPTFLIRHDEIDIAVIDPFNKTTRRKPRIYFEGNKIRILVPLKTDGTVSTVAKFKLTYLREVVKYTVAGAPIDLNGHTHREVVEMAARDIMEIIESNRVRTSQAKILNVE